MVARRFALQSLLSLMCAAVWRPGDLSSLTMVRSRIARAIPAFLPLSFAVLAIGLLSRSKDQLIGGGPPASPAKPFPRSMLRKLRDFGKATAIASGEGEAVERSRAVCGRGEGVWGC